MNSIWTRRQWLTWHAVGLAALMPQISGGVRWLGRSARLGARQRPPGLLWATRIDPAPWQALVRGAVEAARAAGAQYADARVTRRVVHSYGCSFPPRFNQDEELIGVGVRALVGGSWGFSASNGLVLDEVVRLAQDAVRQAKANAKGAQRIVELGQVPIAAGTWATPILIDPFTITIEEKRDMIQYWRQCVEGAGLELVQDGGTSWLTFIRQERVVATSEGALFTQTGFESGGGIYVAAPGHRRSFNDFGGEGAAQVHGIDWAGAGWELFLNAKIPEQFLSGQLREEMTLKLGIPSKPGRIGKYTLVCDGATMAAVVEATLGIATQLDRALGYEANGGGTSWIDNPLGMVGTAHITSPLVTLTANRSVPRQLATVKWDEEGVEPAPFPLIQDGVLVDFQTTREQAAWLAPYYQRHGNPMRSHGCAAVESAHGIPLQQMPNLILAPSTSPIGQEDLVSDVPEGIMIEHGSVAQMDAQGRTGVLLGEMREIRNGRLGKKLQGSAILFDTETWWKELKVLGGPATIGGIDQPSIVEWSVLLNKLKYQMYQYKRKGQPPQSTAHSVRAVAATITNQPLVDLGRKA